MGSCRILVYSLLLLGCPWTLTTAHTMPSPDPTTPIEQFKQTFGTDESSVSSTQLVYGRSASLAKFEYGIYLQNATWFDANTTCTAEGYENLLHIYDPKRMYWTVKRHLRNISPNFLDLLFWSGYIRLDPCSAVMFNSTCGTDVDPSIPLFEFDVKEKQCAAISHRDVSQSDWRFCSERHPFICEKQLVKMFADTMSQTTAPTFICRNGLVYNYTSNSSVICPVSSGNSSFSGLASEVTWSSFPEPTVTASVDSVQASLTSAVHSDADSADVVPALKTLAIPTISTFVHSNPAMLTFAITTDSNRTLTNTVLPSYSYSVNSASALTNTLLPPYSSSTDSDRALTNTLLPSYDSSIDSGSALKNTLFPSFSTSAGSGPDLTNSLPPSFYTLTDSGPDFIDALIPSYSTTTPYSGPTITTSSATIDSITAESDSASMIRSAAIDSSATDAGPATSIPIDATVATTIGSDTTLSTKLEYSFSLVLANEASQKKMCKCPCGSYHRIKHRSTVPTAQAVSEIIRKLEIPKQNTGKYKRKLSSVGDGRTSSFQLGGIGLAVLVCTFASIVVFDILKYLKQVG